MATQEKREQRVREGSRRKRDRAAVGLTSHADSETAKAAASAVAEMERERRLRPQVIASEAAITAWASATVALRAAVPDSTYRLWLEPLDCIGEVDGALAIEAPVDLLAWVRRRYGSLVGEAIRRETDHRGAFLFCAAPDDDGDGVL